MDDDKHIFLSYSRKDEIFVFRFRDDLIQEGLKVWMDQTDILPGDRWDDTIQEALKRSKLLVLIISPASAQSEVVRNEVYYASNFLKIPIFPIQYKVTEDIPILWHRHQLIEFHEANYDAKFSVVLDVIRKQLHIKINNKKEFEKDIAVPKSLKKKSSSSFWKHILEKSFFLLIGIVVLYLYTLQKDKITKNEFEAETKDDTSIVTSLTHSNNIDQSLKSTLNMDVNNSKKEEIILQKEYSNQSKILSVSQSEIIKEQQEIDKSVLKEQVQQVQTFPVSKQKVQEKVTQKRSKKELNIEMFKNAPYDNFGIVQEFVQHLQNGKNIVIIIRSYVKDDEDNEIAYTRAYNMEDWLIKRGIEKERVEIEVVDGQKGGISYEIAEKVE